MLVMPGSAPAETELRAESHVRDDDANVPSGPGSMREPMSVVVERKCGASNAWLSTGGREPLVHGWRWLTTSKRYGKGRWLAEDAGVMPQYVLCARMCACMSRWCFVTRSRGNGFVAISRRVVGVRLPRPFEPVGDGGREESSSIARFEEMCLTSSDAGKGGVALMRSDFRNDVVGFTKMHVEIATSAGGTCCRQRIQAVEAAQPFVALQPS